jgi:NAD(P)-dependent dehydrogenase (short-subunit alcohol dehydrogenase family)
LNPQALLFRLGQFADKITAVTGGGTGMGRELVRQLVAGGCNVAMCDLSAQAMAETKRLCEATRLPQGVRITTHVADVSDERQVERFRDEVAEQQATDRVGAFRRLPDQLVDLDFFLSFAAETGWSLGMPRQRQP